MSLKKTALSLAVMLSMTAGAFAAETAVGGVLWVKTGVSNIQSFDTSGSHIKTGVLVDRAYLTFNQTFNDVWSVRVILDSANWVNGDAGDATFLKNAYVSAQLHEVVALKFGVIGNIVGTIADSSWSDMRWINKAIIDQSSTYLSGANGYNSANPGIALNMNFLEKMLLLDISWSTADGYKKFTSYEDADTELNAAFQLVLAKSFRVGLFFNAFLGPDGPAAGDLGYGDFYYGAGLSYYTNNIKAGVIWTGNSNAGRYGANDVPMLIEAYGNINLKEAAGVPLLILARLFVGLENIDTPATLATKLGAEAGIGYEFNKNVKIAIVWQLSPLAVTPIAATTNTHAVQLMTEVKI